MLSFADLAAANFDKDFYGAFTKAKDVNGKMTFDGGMTGTGRCNIGFGNLERMPF